MLRRLPRLAMNGVCLLSLVACLGTAWLWRQSRGGHRLWAYSTAKTQYTLHSADGRLTLAAPPGWSNSAGDDVWAAASRISNADISWGMTGVWRPPYPEPALYLLARQIEPGSGTSYLAERSAPPADWRPVLKALEDPQRAVAAHLLLLKWTNSPFGRSPPPWYSDQEQHLEVRGTDLTFEVDSLHVHSTNWPGPLGSARPDLSQWAMLRDQWHGRLDVTVVSVACWQVLVMIALAPAAWSIAWLRRSLQYRRRLRQGLCTACGYDLRALTGRCGECGAALPGATRDRFVTS